MKIKKTTKLIFLSCFLFVSLFNPNEAFATHIVGGEITLTYLRSDTYNLSLIIYFDEILGQQGAKDSNANVSVFRKSDNTLVETFNLIRVSETNVEYTDPNCAVGFLSTSRQLYTSEVRLDPNIYNDQEGYYIVYERCCRNGVIQNIFDPGGAGQAFYMEFPAVVQNGQPFINSSPTLFPPLSDYACIGQPFFFDFSGQDVDGDSLAYSLAAPLNGFTSRDEPVLGTPRSGPYPTVQFLSGYNVNNMVRGTPSLSIDPRTGELNLTPSELGLFVFSIKCEEFRDGEKIGEVVRDFQLSVLDCPIANEPSVFAETEPGKIYNDGDTLVYKAGEIDNCLSIFFTDPDSNTTINTRFVPLNFPNTEIEVRNVPLNEINPGDTARFDICLKECPALLNGFYEVLALIGDNSCSLPLYDTLKLFIDIQFPNTPPEVVPDLPFNTTEGYYEVDLKLGDTLRFDAVGTDLDGDTLIIFGIGDNYILSSEGMVFPDSFGIGEVSSSFTWTPTCDNLDDGLTEESFLVDLIVGDIGKCGIISQDTARIKINLIDERPPNNTPIIIPEDVVFDEDKSIFIDTVFLGESYVLPITATDPDLNELQLEVFGDGFDLESLRMRSTTVSGQEEVTTSLVWNPICDDFSSISEGQNELIYEFVFKSTDFFGCSYSETDSVRLRLHYIFTPDPSKAPIISIDKGELDGSQNNHTVTVIAGEELDLSLLVEDSENDFVSFQALPQGFSFEEFGIILNPTSGNAPINTTLEWATSCDFLGDTTQRTFEITLLAESPASCGIETYDTLNLIINLVDNFRPPETVDFPNAFTPNGDGKSDEYRIGQLPPDICKDKFLSVEITNRWGEIVFQSEQREFAWNGSGYPAGIYFYYIRFSRTTYKGSVHLIRGQ